MQNLDKADPGVHVELLGETFTLRYTYRSWAQIYRLTGQDFTRGVIKDNPENTIILLWAGLISDRPDLDGKVFELGKAEEKIHEFLAKLERAVDMAKMTIYQAVIMKAVSEGLPPKKEGEPAAAGELKA